MISRMREKRFYAQLSIYEMSKKTGIDPGRISLIERGYKVPRDDEKHKIAKALSVRVEELFPTEATNE